MTGGRPDVVIVGAGIVGAACAYYLARTGARVTVLDAGSVAGGTSSAGQGNILVSTKPPGPVLTLGRWSRQLWGELAREIGADQLELEPKGGLAVAGTAAEAEQLARLAARQRAAGVELTELAPEDLAGYEPRLAGGLAGGVHYPQDAQVPPVRATAHLLAAAGADVRCHQWVRTVEITGSGTGVRVAGVRVRSALVPADVVVNATGVAAAEVATTAGTRLPIEPRRGFVLVTEPLPTGQGRPSIRHIVYAAGYAAGVASDDPGLQSAAMVESTPAGNVLIGSSRERHAGFDETYPVPVLRRLASQAVALFPVLAGVNVLRAYRGFRPYVPDQLPVIGPDPQVAGLWHACGHEGAGVGLAPATGALIAAQVTGVAPAVDPAPFSPSRFA